MNRQIHKGIFFAMLAALFLMIVGAWLSSSDEPLRSKSKK